MEIYAAWLSTLYFLVRGNLSCVYTMIIGLPRSKLVLSVPMLAAAELQERRWNYSRLRLVPLRIPTLASAARLYDRV